LRIVFDPARLRVNLGQFQLRLSNDAALKVEDNASGAGGALVKGKEIGHGDGVGE
jgi:hypothetical protein